MLKPPPRLTGVTELIDLPGTDSREMAQTLRDLAWINRYLGGTRVVLRELPPLLEGLPPPVRILDVATGFADIPRAIVRWARGRGLAVEVEAVDRGPQVLELAREACAGHPQIRLREGDALDLPYPDGSFDVALASLVLHHMEGDAPARLLGELHRVARRGVLVNDLRRGRWPHAVTWACLHAVSRNRLIRNDGPLSIRRGFLERDLLDLARAAGWKEAQARRHPFFRLALVGRKR
jgi:SAM-dependent methyltransferase